MVCSNIEELKVECDPKLWWGFSEEQGRLFQGGAAEYRAPVLEWVTYGEEL